jgi:DNA ligase (NAD+)
MGSVGGRPKSQIAWKFDPPGAATTFLHETWDVGRTGVITPLAHLEPVKIAGSTITKATLHNVAQIKSLGIGRGDLVMLLKAGDIIPYIDEVIDHKGTPIVIPTHCPSCQSELDNDGIRLFCRNNDCPGQTFYRIMNWIKVTKIDDFGEALARKLQEIGKFARIEDLYNLSINDISSIGGWGDASADKIVDNISNSKKLKPEVFLSAIGIPGISTRTAEELLKAFGTIQSLLGATVEEIAKLHGYSDVSATKIVSGLKKYHDEILGLLKRIDISTQETGGKLDGLSFCFTGALSQPRSYYQNIVTENGGRNLSGVTKDLKYLVCNADEGSSKSLKAAKLGTKVINEQEFLALVGDMPPANRGKLEIPSLFG